LQSLPKARVQGVKINVFDGQPVGPAIRAVLTAAALGLANALLFSISNLRFGPEVGIGKPKGDVPVISSWLHDVNKIAVDLSLVAGKPYPPTSVHLADARQIGDVVEPNSVDAVITSPPYPNEKDCVLSATLREAGASPS